MFRCQGVVPRAICILLYSDSTQRLGTLWDAFVLSSAFDLLAEPVASVLASLEPLFRTRQIFRHLHSAKRQ